MSSVFSKIFRSVPFKPAHWPKWLRWTIPAVVVVALGVGGFAVVKAQQAKSEVSQEDTLQTSVARQGDLTLEASGTGTLEAVSEVAVSFEVAGKLKALYVKVGDEVEEGQLLAELDGTSQQLALENAEQALRELTSGEAIANAKLAVTSAQSDVLTAQYALNNLQYWKNDALIQNYYASLVIAKAKLDQAQEAYDHANVGEYINNSQEAQIYQALYAARVAYDSAEYYYSVYSQAPSQREVDEAEAELELAQAKLTEAQNYLAALTGGDVPEDATGSSLEQFRQAQLAVQDAQDDLDATKLYAPISGTIMTLSATVGNSVSGSIMTIDDLSQASIPFYMDASDWSNVKVGYEVSVYFDELPDATFSGKVTEVLPGLVTMQGASMVQGLALLDSSLGEIGLPVGVIASVDVISGQAKNAVLVPVEALHEISPGVYTVFVVEDGQPKLRSVEVGLMSDTYAEIKSGVEVGEVVTTGIMETQ